MADRNLFSRVAAERMAAHAGDLFRPDNGYEGDLFYEKWCADCQRDAAFRADPGNNRGCSILALVVVFTEDDPNYPKDWVVGEDGQPLCRSHQPEESARG